MCARGLVELPGADVALCRELDVSEPLRRLTEDGVACGILGIKPGQGLVTRQRVGAAILLYEEFCGGAELLDGFRGTVLFLQQRAVAHPALRGLRERLEKAGKDCRGLGSVARLDEPVELRGIVFGRARRFVEPRVQIRQSLKGFLVAGSFGEDRLIFFDGVAEFVFL